MSVRGTTVYYSHPGGRGWDTVELMAQTAARWLEADLVRLDAGSGYSRSWLLRGLLPRPPRRFRGGPGVVIAGAPAHLNAVLALPALRRAHDPLVGWVIDSFWHERIPRIARGRGVFDRLFITDAEFVPEWESATGTPTTWLPFGADVLDAGSAAGDRPVDVQRAGRQPAAWDDDDAVARAAAELGLTYRGRTPFHADPARNQAGLMAAEAEAKFTLAFSNVAAPADYTHPTRQYLTGRWTDALASGSTVAGIAPVCRATSELLWPEALLELGTTDRDDGLRQIAAAVQEWIPARARLNHLRALERLDWRWRIERLAREAQIDAPGLPAELTRLLARIAELTRVG